MTFKEFFNKQDSLPISNTIQAPKITGMSVVKDYMKDKNPEFFAPPKAVAPHKPATPSMLMLPHRKPLSQRPVEKKPTDFLARKSDPTKNK